MSLMKVLRVVVHAASRQPVLLLGEVEGGRCGPQPPERQLREFRQFIDQVSPEDFGQPPTDGPAPESG